MMGASKMWNHQLAAAGLSFYSCGTSTASATSRHVSAHSNVNTTLNSSLDNNNSTNTRPAARLSPEELAALLILPRSSPKTNVRTSSTPGSSLSRSGSIRHRDGSSRRHHSASLLSLDAHNAAAALGVEQQRHNDNVTDVPVALTGWGVFTEEQQPGLCYMTMPVKPPYSYATLIKQALAADDEINRTKGGKTLQEIYQWIEDHYCYYRPTDIAHDGASSSWKSSVRHNLAFGECFNKTTYHVVVSDDVNNNTDSASTSSKPSRPQRKRGSRLRKCTVWSLVTDAEQQFRPKSTDSESSTPRIARTASANAVTPTATPPVQHNKNNNKLLKRALTNFELEFNTSSSTLASRVGSIAGSESGASSRLSSPVVTPYRTLGRSEISMTTSDNSISATQTLPAAKRQCINEWRAGSVAPSFAASRASADNNNMADAAAEDDVNAHFVRALLSSNSLYEDEWPQQLPNSTTSQSELPSSRSVAALASLAREPTTADYNTDAALGPLRNVKPEQLAAETAPPAMVIKSEEDAGRMCAQPDFSVSVDFLARIGRMHVGSEALSSTTADNTTHVNDLGRFMIRTPSATTTASSTGSSGCGARDLADFFSACAWDADAYESFSPGSGNIDTTPSAALVTPGNTALGMTGAVSSPSTISTGALDISCGMDTEDVLVDYIAKSLAAMQ